MSLLRRIIKTKLVSGFHTPCNYRDKDSFLAIPSSYLVLSEKMIIQYVDLKLNVTDGFVFQL